jgi:predicted ATPase/class 3 adenylate cyclase
LAECLLPKQNVAGSNPVSRSTSPRQGGYAPLVTQPGETHTATFLMTDIAGSTRLWEEQRDAMVLALAAHDALLRAAVEDAGGTVFKTTGDGLLAAFERPGAALRAAVAGQRALQDHAWPTTAPLLVRMAIHAGDAELRNDDYFGPSLNRVARVLAIGHGGQVLVSSAAAALVADDLPAGATLLDRGEHHLKDLARPEHVYQLAAPGLITDFPPLRSGAASPTNLPADLTTFIGRGREAAEIRDLLHNHRFATLVGVGGTGKTRLMLHVAGELSSRHHDGAWLIELAPLREPDLVASEVARALGVQVSPAQSAIAAVTDFLRGKDLLLLLDNCEHLIEAAATLVEHLLASCRMLHVLATSREALGVPGEATYQVPSLAVPETLDHLDLAIVAATEAVSLFVERATTTLPSFRLDASNAASVVEICRRLDGIPLALELAAARANVLSPAEIAQGLGDRFRLLTGGRRTAVPRQQTLQALIDWSWDLLTEADQRLLSRLSVFTGGWTLEAAAGVSGDQDDPASAPTGRSRLETLDGLGRLVDRSLLVVTPAETTRYGMLETIRQYANDRLIASGEVGALRSRHLAWFRRLAADAQMGIAGREMVAWLGRLAADLDNLRTALDWALETDIPVALEMFSALGAYWRLRGLGSEGVDRMAEAIEVLRRWRSTPSPMPEAERTLLGARVMVAAFNMSGYAGWSAVSSLGDETIAIARASGDPATIIDALVLGMQTEMMIRGGRQTDRLRASGMEALQLAADLNDPFRQSTVLTGLAMVDAQTDPDAAEVWLERAFAVAERSGNPAAIASTFQMRGRAASRAGRHVEAQRWFREAVVRYGSIGDMRFTMSSQSELAHALRRAGATDEAETEYRQTIVGWQHIGNRGAVANQLESLAFTAIVRGAGTRAARLFGAAEALREASGDPMTVDERGEYDAFVDRLRTLLDAAALGDAWADGRSLTAPDAVALAVAQ